MSFLKWAQAQLTTGSVAAFKSNEMGCVGVQEWFWMQLTDSLNFLLWFHKGKKRPKGWLH
jgi:hypothetical protein